MCGTIQVWLDLDSVASETIFNWGGEFRASPRLLDWGLVWKYAISLHVWINDFLYGSWSFSLLSTSNFILLTLWESYPPGLLRLSLREDNWAWLGELSCTVWWLEVSWVSFWSLYLCFLSYNSLVKPGSYTETCQAMSSSLFLSACFKSAVIKLLVLRQDSLFMI